MGMVVSIFRFSRQKLDSFKADPSKFEEELAAWEEAGDEERSVYLDKAWDAIHYLLTGKSIGSGEEPLCWTIYSEQFFDEEQDLGYGPASYLEPEQVSAVHGALSAWDEAQLRERFSPEGLNSARVYPAIWDQDPQSQFEYLWWHFAQLKEFYATAAREGEAVASYIG